MNNYRCVNVYVLNTNAMITVDTFHYLEDNYFKLPKITNEEQMVTAAKDLVTSLKNSNVNNLLENNIKDNINILVNLFKNHVDNIVTKKLTPTGKEQNIEDLSPRVQSRTDNTNKAAPSLRVGIKDKKPPTNKTNTAEHYRRGIRPTIVAEHCYLKWLRVARAANIVQLEDEKLKKYNLVTCLTINNITNPPNELKYRELIKGPDQLVWKRGMCNELGRFS